MNYKKVIIRIIIGIVVATSLYLGIHIYSNNQVINTYAQGFEKNALGDYAKNESNMVLSVYDAPFFQTYTNIAIHHSQDKVDLIIWVPLYNKEFSYGLVVTDDESEVSYQIETNEHLETEDEEHKQILESKQDAINEIKSIAKKEWGIRLLTIFTSKKKLSEINAI
ncbi:hypothetical protein JCM21714_3714 [Gracilibacillus boraciitolerans JCM 21714]|uniref:Uncharacterized protein n=1 Tax=Gracilibacillus boraciitolerans JCM 21714 TaxID=1298598 RepID=W4VN40_9BACI|nr:hypothetical protein [Gracilibacillus boraciitolerans]GAE94551.1 hypothetical protein JCM21714_3714 [Gracilibacillus boraciitolerans JCM 21714]